MPEKPSRTRPCVESGVLEGHAVLRPSELAGVSTDTLRYYERKKVLGIPARSQGGYRLYPPEAVGRVRLVRRALAIGFTLPTGFYSGLRQIWRRSYSISEELPRDKEDRFTRLCHAHDTLAGSRGRFWVGSRRDVRTGIRAEKRRETTAQFKDLLTDI